MTFSLSYEQLTQIAEEEIKTCCLRRGTPEYAQELNTAAGLLTLWSRLAYAGYQSHGHSGYEHVTQDWERLRALLEGLGEQEV